MTQQPNLIPRAPRRMKQPRKDEIRRRLEVVQAQAAFHATPRWWRLWHRVYARLVEVDPRGLWEAKAGAIPTLEAGQPMPPPPRTLPGIAP